MSETKAAKIALITCGPKSRSHFAGVEPLVPKDTSVDIESLEIYSDNLYTIENKKALILKQIKTLVRERKWDGVMLVAAPTEVLNPGLLEDLQSSIDVPVTTALDACVGALRTYSAQRVLLLTPFDMRLNMLIVDHLEKRGVSAVAPSPFEFLGDAIKLTPDEVFEHTRKALAEVGPVDAIYFQGAVLDPLKILDRIERELETTVIASNPAMLWFMLSRLGHRHSIAGYGKLLREWPALIESTENNGG
ncbi:MAG: hypothetical protein JWQ21_2598 [Herminiimonas sp.]|nr:hypothetical protein [Herminiimonas sp.]